MPKAAAPVRFMGGQAVMEGVMMRGPDSWAVAIRTPEGEIIVETHDAPRWASGRAERMPIVRGIIGMAESLTLGFRALTWSANQQIPEEEQVSPAAMRWTMGVAMTLFMGLFLVLPGLAVKGLARSVDGNLAFHLAEGAVRLSFFLGYLALIGRMNDVKRVFEYHGAEHKSIAAYEANVELTAQEAQKFTTEHVRCGTNFLLIVMVTAIFVFAMLGRPGWLLLVASRVVLVPLVAGLAYEVIRFAARHMDHVWVRVIMRPGLVLQKLTTREPSLDQLEVALASLKAVMPAPELIGGGSQLP